MPNCGISTDIIAGFCGETEEEHQDTLSLMKEVRYDFAYMFYYSERPKTLAARKYEDSVSLEDKKRRLNEIIELQMEHSLESNKRAVGKVHKVLIEGHSKRSNEQYCGRNTQNVMIVFPKTNHQPGDYVNVKATDCTSATLIGEVIEA
jgi:tRNA-2-methylthio-N6-dimethylallyladenosine synthase